MTIVRSSQAAGAAAHGLARRQALLRQAHRAPKRPRQQVPPGVAPRFHLARISQSRCPGTPARFRETLYDIGTSGPGVWRSSYRRPCRRRPEDSSRMAEPRILRRQDHGA
jgi:hypothetical protein